jgi:LmbE family N-acetylglucosaminyl deacetylase
MNSQADQGQWRELLSRLPANLIDHSLRVAVLAAHPDDETIGASSLLARSHNPLVIYLTDGAPCDARLWSPDFNGSREEYAVLRREEARNALSLVGFNKSQIRYLGAVDQEAAREAGELVRQLAELLSEYPPDVLITHPYEGGHPDHDTAALVARVALTSLVDGNAPVLVEMTSYHASGGRCVTGEFLEADGADEMCLQLTTADRDRKRKMLDAYASQHLVLNGFDTTQERWRKAPEYDFAQPPHAGKLWYECMGWPMTGKTWRALAAETIAAIQERAWR